MTRRWALAFACAYLLAAIFYRLSAFPGVHGDEAWVGLFALRIRDSGIFTPHEMNTYTGPIYGWILARVFGILQPGVFSLRLPGTAFNALTLCVMTLHFAKRLSWASAAAWLYLLGSSAMFLFKSRVAWEVYALQNLLLAVILTLSCGMIEEKNFSLKRVFVFLAANHIGVLNHFIFLSVPASLFLALFAYMALCRDLDQLDFFQLTAVGLLQAAVVYALKPRISEAFWQHYRMALIGSFAALPLFFTAVYAVCGASLRDLSRRIFETPWLGAAGTQRLLQGALAVGLALFAGFHLLPIVEILSGVAVFQRMVSWTPPLALRLFLYAWASSLLGVYCWYALKNLAFERIARLSPYERLLVFLPLVYMAVFIVIRNTSSIRYYVIPIFMLQASLAAILPKLERFRSARWVCSYLCAALLVNACYWREVAWPKERRPIQFKIGWRRENSWDFLDKGILYGVMEREGLCQLVQKDSMVDLPLIFHVETHRFRCDNTRAFFPRLCRECEKPPFFTWSIRRA